MRDNRTYWNCLFGLQSDSDKRFSLAGCKQLIVTLLVVRFLGFVSVLVHFDWLSISIFYATLVVKFEIRVKDL